MKKFLNVGFILLFTLSVSCSKVSLKDTRVIKTPKNENLIIEGNWLIEETEVIDENIQINQEEKSLIKIERNKISVANKDYEKVNYKLKVVNNDYVLSHEFNFKLKDIIKDKEKIEVISIISYNKIVGEFILEEDNSGYFYYQGILFKLKKSEEEISHIKNKEIFKENYLKEDYNDPIGVMLALKSKREELEDGSYSDESYRTLWISFKDDEIQPILEKDYIIFPRMKGIWSIKNTIIRDNNKHLEYFTANIVDSTENNFKLDNVNTNNIYKSITFISSNYISMEMYQGNNFENEFSIYKTIPIDNINSDKGLRIEEIYSEEGKQQYKKDFDLKVQSLNLEEEIKSNLDYSNFKVDRLEGKWRIMSSIPSLDEKNKFYTININPVGKILNYDKLLISWKNLKNKFPFMKDAYTSPNGRIAIIMLADNLLIYEIEEDGITLNLLNNIDISENEEVIMAEWASGSYVDNWEKVFEN